MHACVHIYLIFSNDISEFKWVKLIYTSKGSIPMYTINDFFINAHLLRLVVTLQAVKYFYVMTSVESCKYGCLIYTDISVIHKLETEKQVEE